MNLKLQRKGGRGLGQHRSAISGMAVVAIAFVVAVAAGVSAYGIYSLGSGSGAKTITSTSTTTKTTTQTATTTATTTATSASTTTATGTASQSNQTTNPAGAVSILLSDPPILPDGVTALFITYPNMLVHIAGLPDGEGWVQAGSSGSVELLGTVDLGQTVASASIPAGVYNMVRFNVSSADVTYNAVNYTAMVQNGNLTVHFISFLTVDPSQPSALVVDVTPFILNIGTTTDPQFVLKPTALSFPVPPAEVRPSMAVFGNRYQFTANNTWFWSYRNSYSPSINITSASLSSSLLVVGLANYSNQSAEIRAITVSAIGQSPQGGHGKGPGPNSSTPGGMSGSAVFLILPNGTLSQLSRQQYGGGPLALSSLMWSGSAYTLAPGAGGTFSYGGSVLLSLRMSPNIQPGTIVQGQEYLVTVIADGACDNFVVVAG